MHSGVAALTTLAAGANPFLELRPLRITYGDVQTRLRTDETLFNITGEDDWTSDDRKRFRNATGVLVNSDAAVTQGWVAKPPYSLLVNPLAPAPPGSPQVAESDRLGRNLARAAVMACLQAQHTARGSDTENPPPRHYA